MNRAFNRMWYASIASAFADGMIITAAPLLGRRLTEDPFLISLLSAMSYLPWLIFAIAAGVVVDRVDRRLVLALSNAARFAVIGALAAVVGFGRPEIWLLLACSFVMGACETLSDSASVALMPVLAGPGQLDRANSRIQGAQVVVRQLVASPVAAWLFAIVAAAPFAIGAASFGAAALLALAIPVAALKAAMAGIGRRDAADGAAPLPADGVRPADDALAADGGRLADSPGISPATRTSGARPGSSRPSSGAMAGLAFLVRHPRLRPLWLCATMTAAGNSLAQATVVLYLVDELGVAEKSYGIALAFSAIGGLIGAATARPLSAWLGRGTALLSTMLIGGAAIAGVGFAPTAVVAVILWGVSAWGSGVWNVLSMSARQQLMPLGLMGRIHGVWRTVMWGIIPVGSAVGGLISRWSLGGAWVIGGGICLLGSLLFARTILSFNRKDAPDVLQS